MPSNQFAITLFLQLRFACSVGVSPQSAEHPNILFIVSEKNGPGLGGNGSPYARTPGLDRRVAEGAGSSTPSLPVRRVDGVWTPENGAASIAAVDNGDRPSTLTLRLPDSLGALPH
jgi:hypothetical protein